MLTDEGIIPWVLQIGYWLLFYLDMHVVNGSLVCIMEPVLFFADKYNH